MWLFELRRRGDRRAVLVLAERGPGQGAAVRRLLARGDRPGCAGWPTCSGPALAIAVRAAGPIDITAIIGQMVQMGDEGHNRNRAGTLMFLREILPALIGSGLPPADVAEVARFVAGNDHFFLNLVMPAGKLMGDAAAGIPGSTVVTAMCRNGTDFGIRVSGHRRRVVHRPGAVPGRAVPGRVRAGRRQPGHRRLGDHRDDGHRRHGDGHRAGDRPVRRRLGARRAGRHRPDVRDHRGREPGLRRARSWSSAARQPASTSPGWCAPASCRRSTPGWPAGCAGTGQVGAGLVTPPMECFTAAIQGLAARTGPG